ncbi:MAG: 3-hydroxyacyl-CoA dehydrogenase [Cyclobacteriaceae bacterium]|nr:3-hydroxyacyl-CoA dehydrogenase [Cyclobacteriaceae bacterium]
MEINKICILGAGTLGTRVALQAAISGFEVSVYDISATGLEQSKVTMQKILHQLRKSGNDDLPETSEILNQIQFTTSPQEAVKNADFINESVTEELDIKIQVWKQIGDLAPEKTWFTTNTSYLLPSMLAESTGRPDKFCAFHFHDVFYSRVVDIMPHPSTDPSMIPMLEKLGRKLNQVPVLVRKENHGYIFNAMLLALLGAAGKLLTKEIASIEDIDRSWMVNFHMPMGPFGIMDSIGLDTAWHVVHNLPDKASQAFAELLKSYLDQGKLGEKSGEGFYKYPNPKFKQSGFCD